MTTDPNQGNLRPVRIEDEMKTSYLDYAMSVIVSRALPDVRDGLKPVQRRILYAMHEMNMRSNTATKKSARVVGEVLGKYHPHGDISVYDALVRMAQDFSMRYPLIDGQGNFGSVDGDPPAAMRYTEVRMAAITEEMLVDIDSETVDFANNFDDSLTEPRVLPARLPNLLINGSSGIAVGMATNIPPHNLTEICDAIVHTIDHPNYAPEELMAIVKGPDFPTGGIILGREGIKQAYSTGRGKVVVRARATIEDMDRGNRKMILISELPFQVNKATLVEKIADLAKEKKLDGISDIRDESDKSGMRIVIELRREAYPEQVLNNLFKHTAMQSTFFVNMLALVDGVPRVLSVPQVINHYLDFRKLIITKRSQYELRKAREREHVLLGLKIALDHLDEVIQTIRDSDSVEEARANLLSTYGLSLIQAQAILDMQLRRLAALEQQKILDELEELEKKISDLEDLLMNERKIIQLIRKETLELKKDYGDDRQTEIQEGEAEDFSVEDLVPHQEIVVSISGRGYAKRLPASTYRTQHRGGRGITGMITREADAVEHLVICDTHDIILFFTDTGRMFPLKAYKLPPEQSRIAKGLPLINLIPMTEKEHATAVIAVKDLTQDNILVMGTKNGQVKRTHLKEFQNIRAKGLIAVNLKKGDQLIGVRLAKEVDEILMVTEKGQSIKFPASAVTTHHRTSGGVRGIRLVSPDAVKSLEIIKEGAYVFVVSQLGFGKLTKVDAYRAQGRGGSGTKTFKVTPKTGKVEDARVVTPEQEIMLISNKGMMIRENLEEVRITGRIAQGVHVMRPDPGDTLATLAVFDVGSGLEEAPNPDETPKPGRGRRAVKVEEGEEEPKVSKAKPEPKAKAEPPGPKAKADSSPKPKGRTTRRGR